MADDVAGGLGAEAGDGVGAHVGAGHVGAGVEGVEGQVAAHDAEADDAEVGGGHAVGV